jgi:hypothetical protein
VPHPLIALLLAVLPLTAFAAEDAAPVAEVENDYAGSILHRPLVLPRGLGQAWFGFELNRNPNPGVFTEATPASSTRIGLGYDQGVGTDIQVGLNAEFQVSPDTRVRSVMASAQYRAFSELSVRLDGGTRRVHCLVAPVQTKTFGLGLPFKHQIAEKVALVSGSTTGAEIWDDIIVTDFRSCPGEGVTYLNLPFAFLFQSDEAVAFRLGSGYRTLLGAIGSAVHFIPLRLEGIMTFDQHIDVGFGVQFAGRVSDPFILDLNEFELFENRLFLWSAFRL